MQDRRPRALQGTSGSGAAVAGTGATRANAQGTSSRALPRRDRHSRQGTARHNWRASRQRSKALMLLNGQDAARTCCTSNGVGAAITILSSSRERLSRLPSALKSALALKQPPSRHSAKVFLRSAVLSQNRHHSRRALFSLGLRAVLTTYRVEHSMAAGGSRPAGRAVGSVGSSVERRRPLPGPVLL